MRARASAGARLTIPNPGGGCLALPVASPMTYSEPTGRSADLQSAVPQNCILHSAGRVNALARVLGPADYKSAIQQIANLRYVTVFAALRT